MPGPFVPDGWQARRPPPSDLPADVAVWGSAGVSEDRPATGRFEGPWYPLATPPPGQDLVTDLSGLSADGNEFRVQFGRRDPSGDVRVSADRLLETEINSSVWRSLTIDVRSAPPDADRVRLVAVDTSTAEHGWLAFTAPAVQRWVPLNDYLARRRPTGLAWQIAFLFPCVDQPHQRDGVTEPAAAAVSWGSESLSGLRDWPFDPERGGVMGQTAREATVTRLSLRFRDFPGEDSIEAYVFRQPFPPGRYDLQPPAQDCVRHDRTEFRLHERRVSSADDRARSPRQPVTYRNRVAANGRKRAITVTF